MQCRTDRFCSSGGVESTFEACCSHRLDPPGVAYTIDGVAGCNLCPIGMYHNLQYDIAIAVIHNIIIASYIIIVRVTS